MHRFPSVSARVVLPSLVTLAMAIGCDEPDISRPVATAPSDPTFEGSPMNPALIAQGGMTHPIQAVA